MLWLKITWRCRPDRLSCVAPITLLLICCQLQVPSSREAVDADSCWNQALRDEVPGMLLMAMHAFMDLAAPAAAAHTEGEPAARAAAAAAATDSSPAAGKQQQQQQPGDCPAAPAAAGRDAVPAGVLPHMSREAWLDCWLRCLPLEGQAQGFFAALPHR